MTIKLIFAFVLFALLFSTCKKDPEIPKKEVLAFKDTLVKDTVKYEEIVLISTDFGEMYIWLYKATPLHRANFLKWSRDTFYNNTTFHRIISGFMMQGGDFNSKDADTTNDGQGNPGYTVPAEIRDSIKHDRGALGAARDNNPAKASSGTQFYICHSKSGTTGLNGQYTVFGMVMKGLDVIDNIVKQPKNSKDRPYKDIKMQVKVLKKTLEEIKTAYNYIPRQ